MQEKYRPQLTCVAELGCFDGRALKFISQPECYFGFDAGWEGGLAEAQKTYQNTKNYRFIECKHPDQYELNGNKVTLFLSLETMEHIPVHLVDGYVKKIAESISPDGYLFITVPNEKGIFFLVKYIVSKIFLGSSEKYSVREVFFATLGKCEKISRNEHKGFDWMILRNKLSDHFSLIETSGVQFSWLPLSLNATIGFVYIASSSKAGANNRMLS